MHLMAENMLVQSPLVSMILLTYKQEWCVEKAIRCALAQDYSNLEIIISDDCSPDDTWGVVQRVVSEYDGPHKVILNRTDKNAGAVANVSSAMKRSSGEIIVLAAGDDYSVPHRVSRVVSAFGAFENVTMVESLENYVDRNGDETITKGSGGVSLMDSDPNQIVKCFPRFKGAVLSYRRCVFEDFDPLPEDAWAEDIILSFRACLKGCIVHIDEPLVYYRTDGGVSTGLCTSLERSLRVNRGRKRCYEQLVQDIRSLHRNDLCTAERVMLDRVKDGQSFLDGLGGKCLMGRVVSALCLLIQSGVSKRNVAVFALSLFPWNLRCRLYGLFGKFF